MKKKFESVYQFKITLEDIKPSVWRRIQVPENYSFWDLHVAIQDAMGWFDCHLHHFEILSPVAKKKEYIGIPDEDREMGIEILTGWEERIADYFSEKNTKADYVYDYGDNWQHTVKLEKILPREKGTKYPLCTGGERACPPEDCDGIGGYEDFLEIIMDPNHKEYEETLEWAGGEFDPEYFDCKKVYFDNPLKRFKMAFESG